MSTQTPRRSGAFVCLMIAASCSSRQPRHVPCPAVISSAILAFASRRSAMNLVDAGGDEGDSLFFADRRMRARMDDDVAECPSCSARASSTTMPSIDFCRSSSSGDARLIKYEACEIGCVILCSASAAANCAASSVADRLWPATGCCSW